MLKFRSFCHLILLLHKIWRTCWYGMTCVMKNPGWFRIWFNTKTGHTDAVTSGLSPLRIWVQLASCCSKSSVADCAGSNPFRTGSVFFGGELMWLQSNGAGIAENEANHLNSFFFLGRLVLKSSNKTTGFFWCIEVTLISSPSTTAINLENLRPDMGEYSTFLGKDPGWLGGGV